MLTKDINNLADVTNALMQPDARNGLETVLHVYPNLAANLQNIYHPTHGALVAIPVVASWANPMQFLCSAIQAGSRLGYQDSAELCAQYLAPILDAIKFNFPPFGVNQFSTAETLPKYVAYSEPRLQPPPGYKDTTVPGIWSRDTLFSHGNHEPGWIVAPGMQGVDVQAFTANMLTPDSLAALMGGPDPVSDPAGRPARWRPVELLRPEQPAAAAVVPGSSAAAGARARTWSPDRCRCRSRSTVAHPDPLRRPAAPAGPALPAEMGSRTVSAFMSTARRFGWRGLVLVVTAMVLTSCGWRGIANVPLPGGPGSGRDKMTVYVQMPDTLALNVNSRVRVADVFVGLGARRSSSRTGSRR